MMNIINMRNAFDRKVYGTAITRADFEAHFTKTRESVCFTFNGWDGKSYDGESRKATVYRTNIEGYEEARFVKVGKSLHYIEEFSLIREKSTGEWHKEASWFIDVLKA